MNAEGKFVDQPNDASLMREELVENLHKQAGEQQEGTPQRAPTNSGNRVSYRPNRHERRKAAALARKEKK